MPRFDGTGPEGLGPLTGRGLGPCGRGLARGIGRRQGLGRGRFCRVLPTALPSADISEKEEKSFLTEDLKEIEIEKKEIEKRLKELKA